MTLSPLVAKGKVMVGVSGGEFGIRGFVAAVDAETGEEAWKTYTVPGPGEPGHETWKGDAWKTGGAPVWIQGNYDPKTNLAYFGTGNGGPWMPDTRPGDNLYSSSAIALDVDTGAIKGHHQYHWNDAWDWDEVSAPILVDIERDGKTVPAMVHAGRNGYLWTLERHDDGKIGFIDGKPFVNQNVFTGLDPKTGRPSYDPTKIPGTNKKLAFCPACGAARTGRRKPTTRRPGCSTSRPTTTCAPNSAAFRSTGRAPGELYIGVTIDEILSSLRFREGVDASKPVDIGQIQAWDLKTGKKAWTHSFQDTANWGPLLTTGGDLVFGGGTSDRMFRAFDAKTGKIVWETRLNSGVTGVPSTYMVDGVQYIAVQAGWGVDAERMMGGIDGLLPEDRRPPKMTQGGVIWVFALGKDQSKQQAAAQ